MPVLPPLNVATDRWIRIPFDVVLMIMWQRTLLVLRIRILYVSWPWLVLVKMASPVDLVHAMQAAPRRGLAEWPLMGGSALLLLMPLWVVSRVLLVSSAGPAAGIERLLIGELSIPTRCLPPAMPLCKQSLNDLTLLIPRVNAMRAILLTEAHDLSSPRSVTLLTLKLKVL